MKKVMVLTLGAVLLLSSCGSYTATGAYTGSTLGSILGSAIGGLSGGPRGSDWGQIIGMAGGAVVGGAIGNAADKAQERKISEYHDAVKSRSDQRYYNEQGINVRQDSENQQNGYTDDGSGFDPNNGNDDRFEFQSGKGEQTDGNTTRNGRSFVANGTLEVSNGKYIDGDGDGVLEAEEQGKIVFEIRNRTNQTIYNVQPQVVETTGNRHILVSPGLSVESIAPGSGIRYTASVVGDRKLKDGEAVFALSAASDTKTSNTIQINIATER